MRKRFPLAQEYQEAFQNLSIHVLDPSIKNGHVDLNRYGLPEPMTGRFACVFKVHQGSNVCAVKCFNSWSVIDLQKRYDLISNYLKTHRLPFFVNFTYITNGILVKGEKYPILKMEWARGDHLVRFIERNLSNKTLLSKVAREFVQCVAQMQLNNIAHGDLQHDNIKVVTGPQSNSANIFLVDYDGMYVPDFAGRKSPELGLRNYQHPKRTEDHYSERLDNFSTLVIYLSIQAVVTDSKLWRRYHDDEDFLILKESDFASPLQSKLIQELIRSPSKTVHDLATLLVKAIDDDPLSDKTRPDCILAA